MIKNGKTYLPVDEVAAALNVPVERLEWNFQKKFTEDGLTENTDFVFEDGKLHLSLTGVLWATVRCDGNFRGAAGLMKRLMPDGMVRFESLSRQLSEITAAVEGVRASLAGQMLSDDAGTEIKMDDSERKKRALINSALLPPLTEEQRKWSDAMKLLLAKKSIETGNLALQIQRAVYRRMRKEDGIDWKKTKADMLKSFGLAETEDISSFRCVCYDKALMALYQKYLEET